MQLPVPSSNHPQVQIETVTPDATLTTTVDKSHKVAEIALPPGTDENQVHHFARYLTSRGQVVGDTMVHINGSWETLTEELHTKLKADAAAAGERAKASALAAERDAKAAADAAKAKANKTARSAQAAVVNAAHSAEATVVNAADAAKAKVEGAAHAVEAKAEASKTEIGAAVEGAKIAAEIAG